MAFKWWVYFKYVWTYILFFVWLNYDSWIPCFFAQMVIIHSCVKIVHGLYMLDCRSARHTQKMNLPTNQKGYDNSETTVGKLLARKIRIFQVYFLWSFFDLLFFETSENMAPIKIYPAESDSPHRIHTCLPRSQTLLRCLGSLAFFLVI